MEICIEWLLQGKKVGPAQRFMLLRAMGLGWLNRLGLTQQALFKRRLSLSGSHR